MCRAILRRGLDLASAIKGHQCGPADGSRPFRPVLRDASVTPLRRRSASLRERDVVDDHRGSGS
jgi:hypothetical protein